MKPSKPPLLALAVALAAPSAHAQTNQQAPQIITLPSASKFTLTPSQQTTPAPLPTPAPTPAPAPPPVVATVPTSTPTPAVSRPATAKPAPARVSSPLPKSVRAAPRPAPSSVVPAQKPAAVPTAAPTPVPVPSPTPTAQATAPRVPAAPAPSPGAAPAPAASGSVPVLWVIGAAILGALTSAAFLLRRRRGENAPEARGEQPVAPPRAEPPSPARPVQPVAAHPIAAQPAAVPPPRTGAEIVFRPLRLGFSDQDALLDYELVVINHGPGAMEDIKALLGIISAQPTQDQLIAAFHASAPLASAAPVFTLAAGASQSLSGRLTMRRETILPVAVAGRPMIVPIGLINLRWRQGLSVRSLGEAHMIGPEGEGGKLRPIWLDRGAGMIAPLAARLYAPEQQTQAIAS